MDFMIAVSELEGKNISESGSIKIFILVGGIGC